MEIALVGDSIVEALMLPEEDIFPTILGERLGVGVANLGQAWYGPQQELEVLKRFALPLDPRVCVWTFFEGNDLDDLRRYQTARLDWQGFSRTLHGPIERSFSKNLLRLLSRYLGRSYQNPNALARSGLFRTAQGTTERPYFGYVSEELGQADLDSLADLRQVFEEALRACSQAGVELAVVYVPAKYRVIADSCEWEPGSVCADWPISDLPERVARMVEELPPAIPYLDLTPVLRARAEAGVLPYLCDDTHLNEAGHQAVAEALARFLTRGS